MKRVICSLLISIIVICTLVAQKVENPNSIKPSFPKNSIYAENLVILPSINYDRIIPLVDNILGIVLKAGLGLGFYSSPFLVAEASLLVGGTRHHFELGCGWGSESIEELFGRVGYRYISTKCFMFKVGLISVKYVPVFPAIGVGFAF
jgi:hypothetical protein